MQIWGYNTCPYMAVVANIGSFTEGVLVIAVGGCILEALVLSNSHIMVQIVLRVPL